MRLAFMGSPAFSLPALEALVADGHDIVAVYTQAPRPAGRGQAVTRCPVHLAAARLDLPVRHPLSLRRDPAEQAAFAALDLDAAVVAAYGLILPASMLHAPRRGCINVHASLLPRWRGAGPIQAAILAGDTQTGITIMQMDAGLDTGPMLLSAAVPIGPHDTAASVHDILADLGAGLLLRALAEDPAPRPQPRTGATYAPKLTRLDGAIDWRQPAESLHRQVRALHPWPGTYCRHGGATLKVLEAIPLPCATASEPGIVLDEALTVACGSGALRLIRVQRPGGAPMAAAAYLRGHDVAPGTRFE